MRQHSYTVFDEYIPAGTTLTSTDSNARLAAFDQLALHAVIDNVTATGRIDIFVEHSGDARNWIQRNNMQLGTATSGATGDIAVDLVASGLYSLLWADAGAASTGNIRYTATNPQLNTSNTPFLPFVRLRFVTTAGAHVKVHATMRGPR